ncbi:hypothetical protein SERLADRAFT_444262 [Serpula lacrymans var. lacrymans S7.9]|uniref:Nucleolar pre-ribosomal-associated protein 1 C-terminal domain-containing protein n=1 Tax=Serpula lacrymans var. lacrymans (strain S7.9) TaxID=578457 RepID=F8ND64_SERL9|nr:uncharacterized protein SERLADRAFT_444262 [Serpula lacrymans var. lacrymans S7.9]EGO30148.1 hypothetical protein SERLADRAFT_444262 [Serpula lacrymans var. lacrymans S7.9]
MSRNQQVGRERAQKRPNPDQNAQKVFQISSADDIRRSLRKQEGSEVTEALIALRNKFSVKPAESVSPQDERLLLAKQWMDVTPGAQDVFEIWEKLNPHQMSSLALPVSLLSSILVLLSVHFTNHSHGLPIIKTLLSPPWMRRLTSYLGGSHNELILVTVRLLNAISAFGGGRERKSLLDVFPWETKSLPKLLYMRRRGKNDDQVDMLSRPDIRTWYILLILSFVDQHTPTIVKTAFLEQHREVFLAIFKGLVQDSYVVARKILEVCWAGLWSDPKIRRTLKIGLFNEITISHLLKLYDHTGAESSGPEHIPADLVHHFLLAICTRPGIGICFKDRGWYPRESEDVLEADDERSARRGGKIYNKILSNVLKNLKVNEDSRQQELASKIMLACPELVAGYWSGAALTLEPRLSSKWVANIAFFGTVLSQPVPSSSFMLPDSDLYQPSPPPLYNILENILPSVNTKPHLSKGLKSPSHLVQHCTALALAKCLMKYAEVINSFHAVQVALEEDEEDGQWSKRRRDLEKEVRRRVPEFQVIIAFSQQNNSPKVTFLAESAQRLLWLYQRCLPSLVAEARFDVGKLLQDFVDTSWTMSDSSEEDSKLPGALALRTMKQLHVLRLLKASDQFTWSGKMASTTHSYLYVLLKTFSTTRIDALRDTLQALLRQILSESIMFQQDQNEVDLWLASFPTTRRAPDSRSPDGTPLTDETDAVIIFLDDCVQRFLKTPYRYFEKMQELAEPEPTEPRNDTIHALDYRDEPPSSLLMVVLEQIGAKINGKLLSPSDSLAIVTFIRKLLFRLSGKQQDLSFLIAVSDKVDAIVQPGNLFANYPSITSAMRSEVSVIHTCLHRPEELSFLDRSEDATIVQDFLHEIEQGSAPASMMSRALIAFKLIDLVRLTNHRFRTSEIARLTNAIEHLHKPALAEFFAVMHPAEHILWKGADVVSRYDELCQQLEFGWLFIQSNSSDLSSVQCRDTLVNLLFSRSTSHLEVERAICMIVHGITSSEDREQLQSDLLLLLASIMKKASAMLQIADMSALKERVFVQLQCIRSLCFSNSLSLDVEHGLHVFVEASLDSTCPEDRMLVADISTHWLALFRTNILSEEQKHLTSMKLWIRYVEPEGLFDLLAFIGRTVSHAADPRVLEILEAILVNLKSGTTSSVSELALKDQVTQLLALRPLVPESDNLESMIASAIVWHLPLCHDGLPFSPDNSSGTGLDSITSWSRARWKRHSNISLTNAMSQFLDQKCWTDYTPKIISAFLYTDPSARKVFSSWLTADACTALSDGHLATVIRAFLDSDDRENDISGELDNEALATAFVRLLPEDGRSGELRRICCYCTSALIAYHSSKRSDLLSLFQQKLSSSPLAYQVPDLMAIVDQLLAQDIELGGITVDVLDRSLHWAVRYLSEYDSPDEEGRQQLRLLKTLVSSQGSAKPHLMEPVLTVIIQNRLSDIDVSELAAVLVQGTSLKPAVVNRLLQSILHHPHFFKLTASESANTTLRSSIIRLLYVLFNLHPTNTCQPSHVEPLVHIYRGTLSYSDSMLLSIFKLFEGQRKTSVSSILARWSPSMDVSASTSLQAVQNMDPIQMLRTCLAYPTCRRFAEEDNEDMAYRPSTDEQIYDPPFVISLFGHMLSQNPPASAMAWVEVFRTNVVCLLIRSLSSKDAGIREASLCHIAGLWRCLEVADMQEKPQVMHILHLLKDTFPLTPNEPPKRLPSYTSLMLLHAMKGIFYPSNFIYPMTARFLLQRPEVDITDVPMLYNMLYSSSDDWKKERGWIIRFLSDGMMSTEDWRVLKRRHTWDLLASLFQSSEKDQALRHGILEVLANITCNMQATTSLILKSSLLTWIEMQLQVCKSKESLAWVKILENILVTVNASRLDTATNGEWRFVLSRCLLLVLQDAVFGSTLSAFASAASVILRLSVLPGKSNPHLPSLITRAVYCLEKLETTITYDQDVDKTISRCRTRIPLPPYPARGFHDVPHVDDPLDIWGKAVETLWQASMSLDEKTSAWDALTSRLLIWRSMVGEEISPVGEWARREVVCNLRR